ncbi:MAG TPA: hypothetical protein PKC28_00085 [Bdellovibrionales bacterium]|nr:hypothetical protein [Bdellovibrionales bacterium]
MAQKNVAARPAKSVKAPKAGVKKAAVREPQIEKAKAALKRQTAGAPKAKAVAAPPAPPRAKTTAKTKAVEATAAPAEPKVAAKPAKEPKRSRKISIEIAANEAASALQAKWSALYKKVDQIDAKPYNMKAVFEEKTAITHKVLGWGYILANRNDRLEVLFKDGIKYLISNYKS